MLCQKFAKLRIVFVLVGNFIQKRFYNRGTLRGIRIPRWAKIPTLHSDWLRFFNK